MCNFCCTLYPIMLEDYRFSEDMSYASHRLMVRSKDIEIGGVLGPVFGISVAE